VIYFLIEIIVLGNNDYSPNIGKIMVMIALMSGLMLYIPGFKFSAMLEKMINILSSIFFIAGYEMLLTIKYAEKLATSNDLKVYFRYYLEAKNISLFEYVSGGNKSKNFGFYTLNWLISRLTDVNLWHYQSIFYLLTVLIFAFVTIRFLGFKYLFLAVLSFSIFPITSPIYINILRQGLAMMLVFWGVTEYLYGNRKVSFFVLLISLTFHSTTVVIVLPVLLLWILRLKLRTSFLIWLGFVVMYLTNLSRPISTFLNQIIPNEKFDSYTDRIAAHGEADLFYIFIYSTILILFGSYIYWRLKQNDDTKFVRLFQVILIINAVFFLFGYIPFADRMSFYSLLFFPYIIIYYMAAIRKESYLLPYYIGIILFSFSHSALTVLLH
jgi:hypothetical protein